MRASYGVAVALRGLGAACLVLVLLAPAAGAINWDDLSGVDTVTITTTNADGSPRETTIWLLVVDGDPYIRTGDTHWGANAERTPDVKLHVGDRDFLLRAVPVKDPVLAARLQEGFRTKYGWSDRAVSLLPGGGTKLFRLEPRPGS
jgi:hypothetical protein